MTESLDYLHAELDRRLTALIGQFEDRLSSSARDACQRLLYFSEYGEALILLVGVCAEEGLSVAPGELVEMRELASRMKCVECLDAIDDAGL